MPPTSRGWSNLMPMGSGKNAFRAREKYLILMVLATFGFVCFGAIFFLPDKLDSSERMNKVYKVYKGFQEAGRDFILPAPPVHEDASDSVGLNPHFRHNVLDRPDPHKVEDKAKLLAQIELDKQVEEIKRRQQQQVLPKPNLDPVDLVASKWHAQNSTSKLSAKPDAESTPLIQEGADVDASVREKRNLVRKMMKHAWDGYAKYAWGKNEVRPVSLKGHSASVFGSSPMGATIIDGMDTLFIMGLMEEFNHGREWIEQFLDFNHMIGDTSVFETNIRYLGGLLTLFAFTGDEMFKNKAVHVADKLLPAFNSPSGIPYALINFKSGVAKNYGWASGAASILSEFGTLHMEFAYLSDITGDKTYVHKVEHIRDVIRSAQRPKSLYPNYMNPKTGKWGQQHTSIGALGDSFYEYLLKEWLRSGKKDQVAKAMFDSAATEIESQLVKRSRGGLLYFAEYKYGRLEHKMDHLACFAGGMYALAAHEEKEDRSQRWMDIAEGITNTCHESYDRADTKLGPEATRYSDAVEARSVRLNERYFILRPETVESYFVLWRLTHNQKYRDWAWEVVQALEKHCKAEGGYSGIKNVYQLDSAKDDVQQSFFLAETLKYLYLVFSDDQLISLDEWVFNTEAHPLPIKHKNALYRGAV